jgi:hypothetical protein
MTTRRHFQAILALPVLFLILGAVEIARAQDDDESKAIKAEEFIKQRPAKGPAKSDTRARYKRPPSVAVSAVPPRGMVFAQLGVTIWRFRDSTATDKTKELIEEDGEKKEVTLERIEEGTKVLPGQKIRLSLESLSRSGFLYVVDREQYSDGTFGEPLLIFPTKRNVDISKVDAGRLIYIPSSKGKFNIRPSQSSKTQVAEMITVLVSPEPLIPHEQLTRDAIRLNRQLFDTWEKQWGAQATKFEMDGGAGQAMSETEQAAGVDGSPALTQDDPVPQTVYRVAIKPDAPLLVSIPLRFARP